MGAFCQVQGMADNQEGGAAADIQEGGAAAGIQEGVVGEHMAVHTQLEALSALHTQREVVGGHKQGAQAGHNQREAVARHMAGHKQGVQAGHNQQEAVARHMAGHKQGGRAGHTEEQALMVVDNSTPEAAGSKRGLVAGGAVSRQDCVVPRAGAFPVGA
jgi:hypothetical protein